MKLNAFHLVPCAGLTWPSGDSRDLDIWIDPVSTLPLAVQPSPLAPIWIDTSNQHPHQRPS